MTQPEVRNTALGLAIVGYTTLDTLATSDFVHSHFSSVSPTVLTVLLILSKAIEFTTLFLILEAILLKIWARHILGCWAYRSESGNFGLATISLAAGRMKYRVELYKTKEEVIGALKKDVKVRPFAQVHSLISEYEDGEFYTDYHIEHAEKTFMRRKGLLRLIPTTRRGVMTGYWHSTYTSPDPAQPNEGTLEFLRKKVFFRTLPATNLCMNRSFSEAS